MIPTIRYIQFPRKWYWKRYGAPFHIPGVPTTAGHARRIGRTEILRVANDICLGMVKE